MYTSAIYNRQALLPNCAGRSLDSQHQRLYRGGTLYVRLYTQVAGTWSQYNDYTYTAAGAGGGGGKATVLVGTGSASPVTGPMTVTWLPLTSQGYMVGEYLSTSFVNATAHPLFAVA